MRLITGLLIVGSIAACSGEETSTPVSTADTGTVVTDTGTAPTDTGTAVTDTGTSTSDASSDAPSDAGKKALGDTCTADGDCESNVCFMGGMGNYCTLKCTNENAATVCIKPLLPECNTKGYCKKM